jgi:galactonate dehydratase
VRSRIELALGHFGKSLGLPVWRLLGGKVRDKVRVYNGSATRAVYETVERRWSSMPRRIVEGGYTAFKAVFIPYTHYHAPVAVAKVARG